MLKTLISREKLSKKFWVKNSSIGNFLEIDNFDITRKIVENFLGKNSWKCNFLVIDNFDFPRLFNNKVCQN